jgi:hypothetical protein
MRDAQNGYTEQRTDNILFHERWQAETTQPIYEKEEHGIHKLLEW